MTQGGNDFEWKCRPSCASRQPWSKLHRIRRRVVLRRAQRRQFAGRFQHRISYRADMRIDALEVGERVEMQRGRLQALRSAFAQPLEMAVSRLDLGFAQL